jgi:hypothetical protein
VDVNGVNRAAETKNKLSCRAVTPRSKIRAI